MTELELRENIAKSIWKIADGLRNMVDGWDFKEYVLGFMFYKYISERLKSDINENERQSDPNFDYADLSDEDVLDEMKESLKQEKGYFILPSDLFENVLKEAEKSSNAEGIQERLKRAFDNISESARGCKSFEYFSSLFSVIQLNSSEKLGKTLEVKNKRILEILKGINKIKQELCGEGVYIDSFGAAYEYLIGMYAQSAGKSGGEFFTPSEVSELLAKLALDNRTKIEKVYDPACGSGSLLLKFLSAVKEKGGSLSKIYGQEINDTTHKLAFMNMFLRNVNYNDFDIAFGDTLLSPLSKEHCEIDAIVSNPPYSSVWKGHEVPEIKSDPRYSPAGALAPKNRSDLAFVMHSCYCLKNQGGVAAIVLFPGVFYRKGAEEKIRKYLIEGNYVDSIIALPDNLFFGTNIATCILVLKKGRPNTDIFFIDASKEFEKAKTKNRLAKENIQKILDTYFSRKEIPFFSRSVSYEEIKEQDYNLAINRYVFAEEKEEEIDINELNREMKLAEEEIERLKRELKEVIEEIEAELKREEGIAHGG